MKRINAAFVLVLIFLNWGVGDAGSKKAKRKPNCVAPHSIERYLSGLPPRFSTKSVGQTIVSTQGDVVVVEADSQLLILPNPFDLHGKALEFRPVLRNRYSYSSKPYNFNSDASEALELEDDDSEELTFSHFEFPFSGKTYKSCFINSNGNITFDSPDAEPPNLDTLLDGAPRIAPFFTDLDPQTAGSIFVDQSEDSVTITWLKVPEYFNHDVFGYGENTFQVVLYKDGRFDLVYARELSATQALIGIVPGYGKSNLRRVDFSRGSLKGRPSASLIEDFRNYESIDISSVMKAVYSKVRDNYDFATLLSNFELTPVPDVQAFAINVQNEVRGIGNPSSRGASQFRDQKKYGSAERLQNITFLGNLHGYPSDPDALIPDTYTSTLQILAHEVGHRWLSYVHIQRDGRNDDFLLGRDKSHWSFFLDTDGSFVEGNEINSRGTSFVTSMPFQGYSNLDLYLMGFLKPDEVRNTFVVEGARRFSPDFPFAPESSPEPGVSFQGSEYEVKIDDIIAANGAREPDSTSSQKSFNHVFILVVKKENPTTQEELSAVALLQRRWESFFNDATLGLGKINTALSN